MVRRHRGNTMTIVRPDLRPSILLAAALALSGLPATACAQSQAASHQSEGSLAASLEVPLAVTHALSEGARFTVTAVQSSGETALLTVSAATAGSAFVVRLSAETVHGLGIVVGTGIVVTAVSTGWILSAAGEALCYIADAATRPLIHSHRISG
ncbi:hypothetical protein [Luteimonas sp. R10]|uniref:hypothetical protein n=1 Tax=Luteimonas sp. R10 TaxID=3108176 RepID=UPI00308C5464|nr:hypothetical protein U3649_16960 [Luteimonas sp. R10]